MWPDQESKGGNFWKKEEEVGWRRDSRKRTIDDFKHQELR